MKKKNSKNFSVKTPKLNPKELNKELHHKSPTKTFNKYKIIFKLLLVLILILTLCFGAFAIYYCYDLPSLDELENQNSKQIIRINYANNNLIINHSEIYQSEVSFYEIPMHLVNAVVAIEDRKFFEHAGIDILAIIRAYFINKKAGKIVQGGSTITQQLAKLLFLKPEKTLRRKIQEAILAVQLERQFTKQQILTFYLNRAYFGSHNYGIGNASRQYFNKNVANLNVKESALLAGLLKAPSKISPKNNPELAKKRTKVVLEAMQECGFLDKNFRVESDESDFFRQDFGQRFYFSDYVYEQISELIGDDNQEQKIIKVTTTLDEKIQHNLENILNQFYQQHANQLQDSQIAVVVMNKAGEILAMTGGKNYQQSQFNRAVKAKRQAGSAFKTFIYLSALENNFTIDDIFEDKKVQVSNWLPDNYRGNFLGKISLKKAFAHSSNSVAVQLAKKVGGKNIAKTARLAGILSPIDDHDLTIALGTNELTLLEIVSGYATIANDGIPLIPYSITQISNDKNEITREDSGSKFDPVFKPSAMRDIKELLREVVVSGTGKMANVGKNIYGKTGTSQNFRDAWFIGFNDELIVGVWIGNDNNRPTAQITGGSLPAQLFGEIIKQQ